jgi:hypothetical protein
MEEKKTELGITQDTGSAKPRPTIAQPPPPPPVKKAAQPVIVARSTREQKDFDLQARKLAEHFGWKGEDAWVLNGVQVSDARNALRRALHEAHQAPLNNREIPNAQDICNALGLTSDEAVQRLRHELESAAREK